MTSNGDDTSREGPGAALQVPVRQRQRAGLFLAFAGLGATGAIIPASLPSMAQLLGVETATLSLAVPALFTGLFLGVASSPAVARRRGPGPTALGAGAQAVALGLFACAPNSTTAVLAATVAGVGFGLAESGGVALARTRAPGGAGRSLLPLTAATATAAAAAPLLVLVGGPAAVRTTLAGIALFHVLAAVVLARSAGTTPLSSSRPRRRHRSSSTRWGAVALFCYVGGETVLAGWSALIPREVVGLSATAAAAGTSVFWVVLLSGRVIGSAALARGSRPRDVLALCQIGGALALACSAAAAAAEVHPWLTVLLLCAATGFIGPCYALLLGTGLETAAAAETAERSATLITVGALGGAGWTAAAAAGDQSPAWLAGTACAAMVVSAAAARHERRRQTFVS